MATLTELERKVFDVIKENTDIECMDCIDMRDLVRITGDPATVLRGVVSSLVKKRLVEVEDFESNFVTQYFYWVRADG